MRGIPGKGALALQDVSLVVEPGEFVMIEGPSGVGKTTLLAVSAGLLRPDGGTVQVAGKNLHEMNYSELRKHRARSVGFVFQRSNLLGALTARENIMMMAAIAGIEKSEAIQNTVNLLNLLGLMHLADRLPETLSGGEEQRVALARAVVNKPAIVFADEPTGSLDSISGQKVAESLKEAAEIQGAAVVVASHDQRLASYASRHLKMEDGRLYE